ncbi:MAG: GxxExxY protein [Bacteroidia bacterium]|nr:GxxExxY protein [Bacteroidia bacterium]
MKKNENFTKTSIDQVLNYLKTTDLKLAILINFTKQGVKFKRIINISESKNL